MAKKKSEKQSRKELLRSDDAFIQAANTGAEWLTENRGLVIGGVVAILVAVALVIVVGNRMDAAAESSAGQLADAVAVYNAEIVDEGADSEADPPTFASEEERDRAAQQALSPLVGNSGVGLLAKLYHADSALRLGELDAAVAGFDEVLEAMSPSDNLYFLAVERCAYAREAKGDLEGALQVWGRLSGRSGFYADRAAFHRARLMQADGKQQEAVELYARFEESFPESSIKDTVQKRIALLADEGVAPPPSDEADSDPDANTDTETTPDADADPDPDPETTPDAGADPDTDTDAGADADSAGPGAGDGGDADDAGDASAETDTGSGSNADLDEESDTP